MTVEVVKKLKCDGICGKYVKDCHQTFSPPLRLAYTVMELRVLAKRAGWSCGHSDICPNCRKGD
jgi:hypothetical protein